MLIAFIVVSSILTWLFLLGCNIAWWGRMTRAHSSHDCDDFQLFIVIPVLFFFTPLAGLICIAAYHLGQGWPLVGEGVSRRHARELRYEALKTKTMDDQARAARELTADTLKLQRALEHKEEEKPEPPKVSAEVVTQDYIQDAYRRYRTPPMWDDRYPHTLPKRPLG